MKQNHLHPTYIALVILILASFSAQASPTTLFTDNGSQISAYILPGGNSPIDFANKATPGVTSLAFSWASGHPVLLAAYGSNNDIYAYAGTGAPSIFLSSISDPVGLAVNAAGDVFVGADGTQKVEEFSPTGTLINTIGSGVLAQSIAFDNNGNLYFADENTDNVYESAGGTGTPTAFANLNINGIIADNLYGMVFDRSGNMYVSYQNDSGTGGGILEVTATGAVSTFYTATTSLPTGLGIDPQTQNLYMTYITTPGSLGSGIDAFTFSNGTLSTNPGAPVITASNVDLYGMAFLTPEPSTWCMFAGGLLAAGFLGRRRSNAAV